MKKLVLCFLICVSFFLFSGPTITGCHGYANNENSSSENNQGSDQQQEADQEQSQEEDQDTDPVHEKETTGGEQLKGGVDNP
jgi:hypothetical protein